MGELTQKEVIEFYSREDIQEELVKIGEDREFSVRFGNGGFGKRPDILQFKGDIVEMAKRGATSFHISEERWNNALELEPGMTKVKLDTNRKGWDLILDIDTAFWDYATHTAYLLIEALKFHNIKNISCKFSGNKGWHLGVPFEAFPSEVNGKKIKDEYPEGLRVIAEYLQEMIREMLTAKMLAEHDIKYFAEKLGKEEKELFKNGKFDCFRVVDIDTVLISSRHLFRSPYSLHEKSGLVSIPIKSEDLLKFKKEDATPDKVKIEVPFLDREKVEEGEAKELLIQAFDWYSKFRKREEDENSNEKSYELPTEAIEEEYFPDCIQTLLKGGLEDGKKRAIFILVNFLTQMGWSDINIKNKILEWNKTNVEPLRENYMLAQLSWHKRQKTKILPPNCENANYYKDLHVCSGNGVCMKTKNPANFAKIRKKESLKKRRVKKKK